MQQRALIEPRVPVLYVAPYLPLCCRSLIRAYYPDADQKGAGRRWWSTKNMHGSGLSECCHLIYHGLRQVPPPLYRPYIILRPTTKNLLCKETTYIEL